MAGPTYTYTPDVPQAATPLNQTQSPILNNFRAINELVNVNHVGFNVTNNSGKHNFTSLINQSTVPAAQSDQLTMFVQATPMGDNASEIFITYPTTATPVPVQISDQPTPTPTGTSGGNATQGYVQFPSGVIMRWGVATMNRNNSNTLINFTTGPAFTTYGGCPAFIPTQSGVYNTLGVQANGYIGSNSMNPVFQGSTSTGGTTTFNYLLMGM